jgi:hypothetical protein
VHFTVSLLGMYGQYSMLTMLWYTHTKYHARYSGRLSYTQKVRGLLAALVSCVVLAFPIYSNAALPSSYTTVKAQRSLALQRRRPRPRSMGSRWHAPTAARPSVRHPRPQRT